MALSNTLTYLRREVNTISELEDENSSSSNVTSTYNAGYLDIWVHHKKLSKVAKRKQKSKKYLSNPIHELKEDPIQIWNQIKGMHPNLYNAATKLQNIMATSVPCERLFSKAGTAASALRNRLTGKRISHLLFLSSLPQEMNLYNMYK